MKIKTDLITNPKYYFNWSIRYYSRDKYQFWTESVNEVY
jgi:hypothetical protein